MFLIFEKIIKYVPNYLWNFGCCFSSPQKFVDDLVSKNNSEKQARILFKNALIFLYLSILFSVAIRLPNLLGSTSILKPIIGSFLISLFGITWTALALRFSWTLVGGKFRFREYFVIDAYVVGVASVLISIIVPLREGIIISLDSLEFIPNANLTGNIFMILGYLAVSVWALIFWEVYRLLNKLNYWRASSWR